MEHHARGLLRASGDEELVQALRNDPRTADLGPRRGAMIAYVVTLTEEPWAAKREQIEALRTVGYSDEAIAVINLVACFFAWCNRIVDGLGVPLEDWWPDDVRKPQ